MEGRDHNKRVTANIIKRRRSGRIAFREVSPGQGDESRHLRTENMCQRGRNPRVKEGCPRVLTARARGLRLRPHDSMLTTSVWPDNPKHAAEVGATQEDKTQEEAGGGRAP